MSLESVDISAAEVRRDTLQSEAAINLAIGFTLYKLGESALEFPPTEMMKFAQEYQVDVTSTGNGAFTYRIIKR